MSIGNCNLHNFVTYSLLVFVGFVPGMSLTKNCRGGYWWQATKVYVPIELDIQFSDRVFTWRQYGVHSPTDKALNFGALSFSRIGYFPSLWWDTTLDCCFFGG
jgi:hypothetical protein